MGHKKGKRLNESFLLLRRGDARDAGEMEGVKAGEAAVKTSKNNMTSGYQIRNILRNPAEKGQGERCPAEGKRKGGGIVYGREIR